MEMGSERGNRRRALDEADGVLARGAERRRGGPEPLTPFEWIALLVFLAFALAPWLAERAGGSPSP